jgi:hypothetical protein
MATEERLQCPVCGARFREHPLCSRCGADLRPLMVLAAKAFWLRQSSRAALRGGDFQMAHTLALKAQKLSATERGQNLAEFSSCQIWLQENQPARSEKNLPQYHLSAPEPGPTPEDRIAVPMMKEQAADYDNAAEKQGLVNKAFRLIKRMLHR